MCNHTQKKIPEAVKCAYQISAPRSDTKQSRGVFREPTRRDWWKNHRNDVENLNNKAICYVSWLIRIPFFAIISECLVSCGNSFNILNFTLRQSASHHPSTCWYFWKEWFQELIVCLLKRVPIMISDLRVNKKIPSTSSTRAHNFAFLIASVSKQPRADQIWK